MAIMDIPTLKPLAVALPRLLKKNGRYLSQLMPIQEPDLIYSVVDS